jgi:hypothetical protein
VPVGWIHSGQCSSAPGASSRSGGQGRYRDMPDPWQLAGRREGWTLSDAPVPHHGIKSSQAAHLTTCWIRQLRHICYQRSSQADIFACIPDLCLQNKAG